MAIGNYCVSKIFLWKLLRQQDFPLETTEPQALIGQKLLRKLPRKV